MSRNAENISTPAKLVAGFVVLSAIIMKSAITSDERWYWGLLITVPIIVVAGIYARFRGNSPGEKQEV